MIKCSFPILKYVLLKLFNIILQSGMFPKSWCGGLISPIFKSDSKQDQENSRGICVSSCLGKLFTMILDSRLSTYVDSRGIIHENQWFH